MILITYGELFRSEADMPMSRLDLLPTSFKYDEAIAAGITKHQIYAMRSTGLIQLVARGIYRKATAEHTVDLELLEIAKRAPRATLCLTTALVHYDLSDANPASIDIALPAQAHRPSVIAPVIWHSFNRKTFDIGREELPLDEGTAIGIYTAERSIVDAFRLRHREGEDLAYTALRRWLRRRGNSPSELIAMTRNFPKTITPITRALEILQYE